MLSPGSPRKHRSSLDGTSRLWNAINGECLRVFADHKASIYTLSFSPDSRLFATAGADGYLLVYDVKVSSLILIARQRTNTTNIYSQEN